MRPGSPLSAIRHVVLDEARELQALVVGTLGEQPDRLLDRHPQVEVHDLEVHLARLYLGEVQDVVDDGEQVLARGAHGLGVLALLF